MSPRRWGLSSLWLPSKRKKQTKTGQHPMSTKAVTLGHGGAPATRPPAGGGAGEGVSRVRAGLCSPGNVLEPVRAWGASAPFLPLPSGKQGLAAPGLFPN